MNTNLRSRLVAMLRRWEQERYACEGRAGEGISVQYNTILMDVYAYHSEELIDALTETKEERDHLTEEVAHVSARR